MEQSYIDFQFQEVLRYEVSTDQALKMRPELPIAAVPSPQLPIELEDPVYLRVTFFVLTTAAELAEPAGPAGPSEPVAPGAPKIVEVSLPEHFFTDASLMTPVFLWMQTRCPCDEAVARSAGGVNALPIVMPPTKSSIPVIANRFI